MSRTTLNRQAVAVAIVLLTFLAKRPIESLVGSGPPLIFFVPAVTISAWQGGARAGLLATALVSASCAYFFFPPIGSVAIASSNDMARLLAFIVEGILTSITMESLLRARDRAERSRREAEVLRETTRRSKERLRAIIDNTDALIYIKSIDSSYVMINKKLKSICSIDHDKSDTLTDIDLFPKAVAEAIRATDMLVISGGKAIECEEILPLHDGNHHFISLKFPLLDSNGKPYAVGCVSTDITSLKEAQGRAVQAERLAAIGQMAAGLAHEGRNALQRSQACLEMLEHHVGDIPVALDLVAGLQEAQDDLHRLYEDVREYAAPIILKRGISHIGALTREAWHYLESSRSGREARLSELGDPNQTCSVDAFRLIQVFRNILDNALDAAHDPVEIDIEWSEVELKGKPAVNIVIRDNGPGLDAEQRCKLFEPFYTTKSKGTGLGMAIVKRIIDAHDGTIVASPDGPGAKFIITLPRGES